MALDTYAGLQEAIADWIDRADLTARIPDFIRLCEATLNRELRKRRRTARTTPTLSASLTILPTNCGEITALAIRAGAADAWSYPTPIDPSRLELGAPVGRPRHYAIVGASLALYPPPDQPYDGELTFLEKVPALADAAPSNWVLADHPDAYLYGALVQAAPFLRDTEGASLWAGLFKAGLDGILGARKQAGGELRADPALTVASHPFSIARG